MLLLSRYLLKHVVLTTIMISLVLTLIIWLTQSLRLLDFIINGGAPMGLFGHMLVLSVPRFYEIILPLSLAIGIVYSLNKLSTDSEMVVMQNSGASPMQLAKGILAFSLLVSLFVFLLSGWTTPMANRELDRLRNVVKSDYGLGMLRAGVFNVIGGDTTIYIADRSDLQDLRGVFIYFNKEGQAPTTITAQHGGLVMRNGKPYVVVVDGVRQKFNPENGSIEKLKFQNYSLDLSSLLNKTPDLRLDPNDRTLPQLWRGEGADINTPLERLNAELHKRISNPFLTLSFSLLALVPFLCGYHSRRGQPWRLVLIGLGVITLQGLNMGLVQMAGKSFAGILLLYGLPVVTAAGCLFVLLNQKAFGDLVSSFRYRRA